MMRPPTRPPTPPGCLLSFLLFSRLPPCCARCDRCCWPGMRGPQADAFEAAVHEAHADSLEAELHPVWGHMDAPVAYAAMQAARAGGETHPAAGAPRVAAVDGSLVLDDAEELGGLGAAGGGTPRGHAARGDAARDKEPNTKQGTGKESVSAGDSRFLESPPLLWRMTFFLERMSMRQALAWETRPRWWTLAFVLGTAATCSYVLRIAFGTLVLCPQYDSDGDRFYDYCVSE